MHGKIVQVLKFGERSEVIIDGAELDKMFLHTDVKNRKIVAFSIIGAFRTGKSFFLDYCLRYMYANYESIKNPTKDGTKKDWMGPGTEALTGFSWRAGVKRDTIGIIMWSDIFLHTMKKTGEEIAIVVMDTQGLFDTETSSVENSKVFAISTLISSIQILNLSKRVQEDQLQYLQFATEFAKFTARDSQGATMAPFQNLIFLIRDWENQDDFELGTKGGAEYLKEVLQVKEGQKPELKSVRKSISTSFEKVGCCLMSYPGRHVAGSKNYNGQWILMDQEFKDVLMITIEKLLNPENLILKKINGEDLKGSEFKEYIKSFSSFFQADSQPLAQSIYEFMIDQQMSILTDKCLDFYKETLAKSQNMTEDNLHVFHNSSVSKTLTMFKEKKKMGDSNHEKKYKAKLEAAMEKLYTEWRDQTIKSLKQAREEKAKVEKAIEEKRIMERKAIEAEKLAKAKQEELERMEQLRKLEKERFERERRESERRSVAMSRSSSSSMYDMFGGFSLGSSMSSGMQCQGTTLKGLQCKNSALPGSSRCRFNH